MKPKEVYLIYNDFTNLARMYRVPKDWIERVNAIGGKIINIDVLTETETETFVYVSEQISNGKWKPVPNGTVVMGYFIYAGWAL